MSEEYKVIFPDREYNIVYAETAREAVCTAISWKLGYDSETFTIHVSTEDSWDVSVNFKKGNDKFTLYYSITKLNPIRFFDVLGEVTVDEEPSVNNYNNSDFIKLIKQKDAIILQLLKRIETLEARGE